MRPALLVCFLLVIPELAGGQVLGRVPFDSHPFKLYDMNGGERDTLGVYSEVMGPKGPGTLWDYEHITDGSGWNGRSFVRFRWWDFDVSGIEEQEIGFFFDGARLTPPPDGWRDGAEYFIRFRVRIHSTPVAVGGESGTTVNNKFLITNSGGVRLMLHMRSADGSACGTFDPIQYPPQDWVSMRISRNIDGPDDGYCANVPVPTAQWTHLQYSVRYGAAGSVFVKAWVNNDDYSRPTAVDATGSEWPQVGMEGRWQVGAYVSDPSAEDVSWDLMDLEVAATFDPTWAAGGENPFDVTGPDPVALTAAPLGEAAALTWNGASDPESAIAAYRVYRGTTSALKAEIATITHPALGYIDGSTSRNTAYYYQVTAVNGVGLESRLSNEVLVVTGDIPPARPTGFTAITGDAFVELEWADNVDADLAGYRLYRSTSPGGPYASVGASPLATSWFTDTSVASNTTYYYVVSAIDRAGHESPMSPEVSARPSMNLIGWWKLDEGAGTLAADGSGYDRTGTLRNGATWTAGIHGSALSFDGVDDFVNTAFTVTPPTWTVAAWVRSPAAPINAAPSGPVHRNSNFQVNWNHPDAAFRGSVALRVGSWHAASFGALEANTWYHLAGTYDGETLRAYRNGVLITSNTAPSGSPAPDTSPMRIGRHASSPNFFAGIVDDVRVYDAALGAAGIAALARFDDTPPAPPASLSANAIGQSVRLSWTAGSDHESGVTGYRIYRSALAGGAKGVIAEVPAEPGEYLDSSTAPSTTYFYQVTSLNGSGQESSTSPEASAMTGDPPPAPPNGLMAIAGNAQVALEWNENAEFDLAGYRVYRALVAEGPFQLVHSESLTARTFTDTSVSNGVIYFYRVTALDGGGHESPFSAIVNATPTVAEATMLAYWALDEAGGTSASDSSGNGWTGTLRSGATWVPGISGSGVTFDGVDDNVATTFAQDLATWTIAVWVRSPQAPHGAISSGPVHRGQNFQINWNHPDPAFRGGAALRIGRTWHSASFGTLEADTWYHLVATYDGETLHTYKNGVLVGSNEAPSGQPTAETSSLRMGREASAGNFFLGTIDDVRVYGRALTAAEVAALAEAFPR